MSSAQQLQQQQDAPPSSAGPDAAEGGAADGVKGAGQRGSRSSSSSKKRGGGGGGSGGGVIAAGESTEARREDFVRIVPYKKPAGPDRDAWRPVSLSRTDKAPQLTVSQDGRSLTGAKGYRLARATHGAHEGTWYFEVEVTRLGETGHCRLGWATAKAELQAPVGFDAFGFGYRDVDGSKVSNALREPYGAPYREGDVVGLTLHMPPGGRRMEPGEAEVVRFKGGLYTVEADDGDARPLANSGVAFSVNGAPQGVAFRDIPEGAYYPAASLYTRATLHEPYRAQSFFFLPILDRIL